MLVPQSYIVPAAWGGGFTRFASIVGEVFFYDKVFVLIVGDHGDVFSGEVGFCGIMVPVGVWVAVFLSENVGGKAVGADGDDGVLVCVLWCVHSL